MNSKSMFLFATLLFLGISVSAQERAANNDEESTTTREARARDVKDAARGDSVEATVDGEDSGPVSNIWRQTTNRRLQSNGFLVEGAYLQEEGEVQHTFTFTRARGGEWSSAFAQEWPLWSEKHQLSVSLPVRLAAGETEESRGVGDAEIEYSYALVGSNRTRVTISPSFALLLPTGSVGRELGAGGVGVGARLPLSVMLTKSLQSNTSVGASYTRRARNGEGERAAVKGFEVGQSFVWLARERFNLLVETVWERSERVVGDGLKEHEDELLVSPGVRWAHKFRNGLTLIPGVAVPVGVGPSRGERGVFFYLAIEHSFKKERE